LENDIKSVIGNIACQQKQALPAKVSVDLILNCLQMTGAFFSGENKMENETISLRRADRVEIVILADNFSDLLLPGGRHVIRPPLAKQGVIPTNTLLAEHGLCLMITVSVNKENHTILLDAGYSNIAVLHNLNFLDLTLENLEAVVLSHGHMDHTGSLKEILELAGRGTRLIVHPDAFSNRVLHLPTGDVLNFPEFPSRDQLSEWGADIVENKKPLLIGDDTILVTGEVARTTSFEKGMPGTKILHDNEFETDIFTDDQSLVIDLADKGLVIISGCAHAGIVNSIEYAKDLAGHKKVHAVVGGFHLSGPAMAPNVEPTIEKLKEIGIDVLCPMHCTGFDTISRLSKELPDRFVQSSVGSTILLQ
jgi:7,8-dihydropterin-6-yl-methyl-4-(beta-D-ribofuranosyl)aminobenzene 5'-phosphate synthase